MNTKDSGNTIPSSPLVFRGRAFQFTINEVEKFEALKNLLTSLSSCDYILACHELAPTTGHEHIHVYAHFTQPYKLSKKFTNLKIHIEVCRGSPQQNIAYIRKDGDVIYEKGIAPAVGRPSTCGELKQMNIDEVPPIMLNTWCKLQTTKIKKSEWNKKVEVHYIYGPSGSGKSNLAQELADDEFDEVKYVNNFWNGCSGEGCCIYDDFRSSHMPASEFINFIDYRTHNLNVKGGNVRNHYTKIIITSIQSPYDIYRNIECEAREQWLRRMIIHPIPTTQVNMKCSDIDDLNVAD